MASFSDHTMTATPVFRGTRRPVRDFGRGLLARLTTARQLAALAVAAPLVALVFVRFGASGRFLVGAFFVSILAVLSAIDVAERRLPNRIVLPAAALVLVAQSALAPERALEWALAAVGAALLLLLPLLVYPAGMGLGDVKLALLLGAALGGAVVTALVVACLTAAVVAVFLLVRDGSAARKRAIPFGPFLALGGIAALLLA